MPAIREILARSGLNKSGITDYCLNPYVGCLHGCLYCYARFMRRFTGHGERWGDFVDIKVNLPQLLAREVRRKSQGEVMISSVCDAWQPLEAKYRLTRACLEHLASAGFPLSILTKSPLVERDLDILQGYPQAELGFTIMTLDEGLRRKVEPAAPPIEMRIRVLEKAAGKGIKAWVFMGPLLPFLSDTEESIDRLFGRLRALELEFIIVDKLNMRPDIWSSMRPFLAGNHPHLLRSYEELFLERGGSLSYAEELRERVRSAAKLHGLEGKTRLVF